MVEFRRKKTSYPILFKRLIFTNKIDLFKHCIKKLFLNIFALFHAPLRYVGISLKLTKKQVRSVNLPRDYLPARILSCGEDEKSLSRKRSREKYFMFKHTSKNRDHSKRTI